MKCSLGCGREVDFSAERESPHICGANPPARGVGVGKKIVDESDNTPPIVIRSEARTKKKFAIDRKAAKRSVQ